MDKLLNEFTVNRPIDETWAVLTNVELIAPCMPGAQLQEIEGDVFRGVVKVKLGAISTAFKGQATFTERDDTAHRAVLKGEGRDTGGKGNADALITAKLESVSADVTKCVVETDLRVTGKVAQFGRGIMADVSKKLLNQFASNLNTMLDEQKSTPATPPASDDATSTAPDTGAPSETDAPETSPPDTAAAAAETKPASESGAVAEQTVAGYPAAAEGPSAAAPAATTSAAPSAAPTVRKIEGPAAEPIELSGVAGTAILKRLLPVFGGVALLLVLLRRLRK